jgi:hypothetical protein
MWSGCNHFKKIELDAASGAAGRGEPSCRSSGEARRRERRSPRHGSPRLPPARHRPVSRHSRKERRRVGGIIATPLPARLGPAGSCLPSQAILPARRCHSGRLGRPSV